MKTPSCRGFSLLELCVGLALVAILTSLSVPSFREAQRATAVRTATWELMTGLQQTRGSAIVESRPGVLCLTDAAGNCGGGDGADGWRAFVEIGTGTRTVASRTLPAGIAVRGNRDRIRFSERALAASTATLTICDVQGVARPRAIVISQNARARFATPAAGACDV